MMRKKLSVGDWVEVRSKNEILRTLDGNDLWGINMRFGETDYVIGSPAMYETDEFDLVP